MIVSDNRTNRSHEASRQQSVFIQMNVLVVKGKEYGADIGRHRDHQERFLPDHGEKSIFRMAKN